MTGKNHKKKTKKNQKSILFKFFHIFPIIYVFHITKQRRDLEIKVLELSLLLKKSNVFLGN